MDDTVRTALQPRTACGATDRTGVRDEHGFPLTLYLLSGWLQSRYPGVDWFSHDAGHLLEMLFGWKANPHFGPFHLLSFALIGGGFWLLSSAWPVLYRAQREGRLATTGAYARVRHPQCVGFPLILLGFLFQWPTMLTLAMFPVLVFMYVRLARSEEHQALSEFGTNTGATCRRHPRSSRNSARAPDAVPVDRHHKGRSRRDASPRRRG